MRDPIDPPPKTIIDTTALTPVEKCTALPYKKFHAYACKHFNRASLHKERSYRDYTPGSLKLIQDFIERLLETEYDLHTSRYNMFCLKFGDGTYSWQFGMPEEKADTELDAEGYFDPDLDDVISDFLHDLTECRPQSGIEIDTAALSISFDTKMTLFSLLYRYTSSDFFKVSTPDTYGLVLKNYDTDHVQDHIASHMRVLSRMGKEAAQDNKGAEFLLACSPGEQYISLEHYLARASVGSNAQIDLPLNQILMMICREDNIPIPREYGVDQVKSYNFN